MSDLLHVVGVCCLYRIFYYAIGEPSIEYNPNAIFAEYTAFIARLRARELNVKPDYGELVLPEDKSQHHLVETLHRMHRFEAEVQSVIHMPGWASAFGLCGVCMSVWVMAFAVLLPTLSLLYFGLALVLTKILLKYT